MSEMTITNIPDHHRYEARKDDDVVGRIYYTLDGSLIDLEHTIVGDEYEGQGIGSALARFALDDARAQGFTVRPSCPFIAAYIRRHPEYEDLIAE